MNRPLMTFPAGRSGAGILLSSAASDNLLLFATSEGPKTDLLGVTSFPKVRDVSAPSPLRNGNLFKARVWDIRVHVFGE